MSYVCGNLHVLTTPGRYIGQLRRIGCRNWETVTRRYRMPQQAFANAASKMSDRDKRIRVLFVPDGMSYYEPSLVMEGRRV